MSREKRVSTAQRIGGFVTAAIDAAPDRAEIIRRLASGAVAPLSIIHTATLALRFAGDDPSLRDLAATLIDRAFSADFEAGAYEAFERDRYDRPRAGHLVHRFSKAGTFTIRVWRKAGEEPLVYPDRAVAVDLAPAKPFGAVDIVEMFPFWDEVTDEAEE